MLARGCIHLPCPILSDAYPCTKVVDGLGGEASPAQGCQREEPWVIPVPKEITVWQPGMPWVSPILAAGPAPTSQHLSPPAG